MDQTALRSQQVLFLSTYREVAQKLVECTQSDTESFNIEKMVELMSERERIIQNFVPSQEDRLPDEETAALLAEVQALDAQVMSRMRQLQTETQSKLQGMQEQKRGHNAYTAAYAAGSAFIDRRE